MASWAVKSMGEINFRGSKQPFTAAIFPERRTREKEGCLRYYVPETRVNAVNAISHRGRAKTEASVPTPVSGFSFRRIEVEPESG